MSKWPLRARPQLSLELLKTPEFCISNAYIIAEVKNLLFFKIWLLNYQTYDAVEESLQHQKWSKNSHHLTHPRYFYYIWHSLRLPYFLLKSEIFADHESIFLDTTGKMVRPGQFINSSFWFDWSENLNVHVNQRTLQYFELESYLGTNNNGFESGNGQNLKNQTQLDEIVNHVLFSCQ